MSLCTHKKENWSLSADLLTSRRLCQDFKDNCELTFDHVVIISKSNQVIYKCKDNISKILIFKRLQIFEIFQVN